MSTDTSSQSARHRRHMSTSAAGERRPLLVCQKSYTNSIEALDLPSTSLTPTLASIRLLVLSYLSDLEYRLSQFELDSPLHDLGLGSAAESLKTKGEVSLEDAQAWARVGLEMLQKIRSDVCSHLPDLPFDLDNISMENLVNAHLPDLPDLRSRLSDIDFSLSGVRSRLEDVRTHLPDIPDVRSHFPDFDFSTHRPLSYIPTLSHHLESLHSHLSSVSSTLPPSTTVADMIHHLSSNVIPELIEKGKSGIEESEDMLERAAREVKDAIKRSFEGSKLIQYADLPHQWRNNEFVRGGYRFIPLERWPLIVLSLFALHNETLNIHTHLIPFLLWLPSLITSAIRSIFQYAPSPPIHSEIDAPEFAFTSFALLCLFCSAVWHTMSGCAHPKGMEICARVDYVGIGWLISASVGTIVYYGFKGHPSVCACFLGLSFAMGLIGNILPFQEWFNLREYKNYRIAFFLTLAFSALAPLGYLSYLYSFTAMLDFITPIFPSIISYLVGLAFYATHFPECLIASSPALGKWFDWIGGGSHAIWHVFIVVAIWQYKNAMRTLREGVPGQELVS